MNHFDLALFLLVYSFLGWIAEAGYYAVARREFCNRGILSLPLIPSYGITFVLLLIVLPTLAGNHVLAFLVTMTISAVVESLSSHVIRQIGSMVKWNPERSRLLSGTGKGLLASAIVAGIYYAAYLIIHPALMVVLLFVPEFLKKMIVMVSLVLMAIDLISVIYEVRTGDAARYETRQGDSEQQKLAAKLRRLIWKRLRKAYPEIGEAGEESERKYIFAKGLCWDKLVWVFLISALLGDIIETFYCGLVNGQWMNRSSILYGPFSFVWGLGAVVLTMALQGLAEKNDRFVFLAGFVIGGVYEYMCSVFTELIFGTVFWDYSDMPLNIGGRTNVLFCFFWGVLAVVWIKIIFPPMSGWIEKIPPLTGKIVTWIVVFCMACNAILTSAAMIRYDIRAYRPEPANALEEIIDRQYGDAHMERRWPNMRKREG